MTDYLSYLILGFSLLQLLVAMANLLFKERLPLKREQSVETSNIRESVSVLIPARDEETNINLLLKDLTRVIDSIKEIIVCDDQSSDQTADVVSRYANDYPQVHLIHSEHLPDGWSGKNHACHLLSQKACGDYLLFLDADVRIDEGHIERSLVYMQKRNCDLMSIFPSQEMQTLGEKMTVPNMMTILLTLLPLPLVLRSHYPSLSAANGQFMLFKRNTYAEFLPHEHFKASRAEDIDIAHFLKKQQKRVSCLTGIDTVHCRMYHSVKEALNGFSKNVACFFGNSSIIAVFYWLITTFGFIIFPISGSYGMLWIWICATVISRVSVSLTAHINVFESLLLLLPQQLMLGVIIGYSLSSKKKKIIWKGRKV